MDEKRHTSGPFVGSAMDILATTNQGVGSLVQSAMAGNLSAESLSVYIEEIKLSPLDPMRVLNSVHVPSDAGIHREGIERILNRIPDGWGRWIDCGPGWYPIVVNLADKIAELVPMYEVHQIKEKYGTLRFYWGVAHVELVCCGSFKTQDPRPFKGAISRPFAPEDRDLEELRFLEEWFLRYEAHLVSAEHEHVRAARLAAAAIEYDRGEVVANLVEDLIDTAEEVSARTCERCGLFGELHENHGWLATLCPAHAAEFGYVQHG